MPVGVAIIEQNGDRDKQALSSSHLIDRVVSVIGIFRQLSQHHHASGLVSHSSGRFLFARTTTVPEEKHIHLLLFAYEHLNTAFVRPRCLVNRT